MNLTLEERQLERAIGSLHAAFDTAANLGAKYVAILTGIQKQTSTLLNCRLERRALLRQYFEGVSHARTVGDLVGAASCLSHAQLELSSLEPMNLFCLRRKLPSLHWPPAQRLQHRLDRFPSVPVARRSLAPGGLEALTP